MLKNMGLIHWLVKSMSKEVGRLPEKKGTGKNTSAYFAAESQYVFPFGLDISSVWYKAELVLRSWSLVSDLWK